MQLRQVKPISKRKAPESAGAPDAVPEAPQAPASPSDADARAMVPMDDDETATQPDTGPMTKAKKRKGNKTGWHRHYWHCYEPFCSKHATNDITASLSLCGSVYLKMSSWHDLLIQ